MSETPDERDGKRRQVEAIKKLDDDTLLVALAYGYRDPNVDWNDPLVKAVIDTRLATRIADGTKAILASSKELEHLTKKLKTLTVVLIVLTILAVAVPVGIEIWKASRESRTEHISKPITLQE